MPKTKIMELNEFGQSAWLDYISRPLIEGGGLKRLIGLGVRGVTSNPTIFDKAISSGSDYDKKISELFKSGKSVFEIYDELTVKDIQDAADLFRDVYEKTRGLDGYISLEVNPKLASRVEETIKEGRRLHKKVNRPNLMLKVPSTSQGFDAVEELVASGINVNVTLIFSLEQYVNSARAYIRGIKRFLENSGDASKVHSVASVFVSRIDSAVDKVLDEAGNKFISLKGKAAVANSGLIYGKYIEIFSSDEFKELKEKGANAQRALWASTSTKDPAYSDIKYVTELIGKGTVNTLPQNTFDAFLDHGIIKEALGADTTKRAAIIKDLKDAGIDINDVCSKLLENGVTAFEKSFESLLNSIGEKAKNICERETARKP